jgi:hypothetical protein
MKHDYLTCMRLPNDLACHRAGCGGWFSKNASPITASVPRESASMASKSKHGRRCIIVMGTVNRVGNDTIGTETVDTNVYSPSKWDRLSQAGPELFYYQCHNCEKVYHHTARMPKHFWF